MRAEPGSAHSSHHERLMPGGSAPSPEGGGGTVRSGAGAGSPRSSNMAEGGGGGGGEEQQQEPGRLAGDEPEPGPALRGAGHCKWFNVRMGFGFISMSSRQGRPLDAPVDVFVHQSKLYMEGFRSLKEGEPVEFTFKKSSKGLESIRVTGPGGNPCSGSDRRLKGKIVQKRKPKGDRCYNCGGLDHHAKECNLPPQPKKCHYCQSVMHMVANCPLKTVPQYPAASQGRYESEPQPSTSREGSGSHSHSSPPYSHEARESSERSSRSPQETSMPRLSVSPEQIRKGHSVQKRKKT